MIEIVGMRLGSIITNDPVKVYIALLCDQELQLLTRGHMALMAACDLGQRWQNLADGPTLVYLDNNGKVHLPEEKINNY